MHFSSSSERFPDPDSLGPHTQNPSEPEPETHPHPDKRTLRALVDAVEYNKRMTPAQVDMLLNAHLDDGRENAGRRSLLATAALGTAFVATETAHRMMGDNFPDLFTLHPVAHTAGQVVNDLFEGVADIKTPTAGEHLPTWILAGAIATGAGSVQSMLSNIGAGGLSRRAHTAQANLRQRNNDGKVFWQIEKDSTIAFVAEGNPLPRQITAGYGDTIQISQQPVEGHYVILDESASKAEIYEALDRANLENAGELIFAPVSPSSEFLPGEEDFMIRIGRMVQYINAANTMCAKEYDRPLLPVLVVGDADQAETYCVGTYSTDTEEARSTEMSLRQRLEILQDEVRSRYGVEQCIRIEDTTDRVMERIVSIAGDRPLQLAGTADSMEKYKPRFFAELRNYPTGQSGEPVTVWYGKKDYTTVNNAQPDNIAVVLDDTQKPDLLDKGIPEERIVVILETVHGEAEPFIAGNSPKH